MKKEASQAPQWHRMSVDEVSSRLETSRDGLSSGEAARRRGEYGPNEIEEKKKKTVFMMFLDQFRDFMIIVLLAAAVVSGVLGEAADTIAIIVIIVLNAVLGFSQEYRAEKAMAALKRMASVSATVIRDGVLQSVAAAELVPGDMVVLEAGNVVAADVRLFEASQLKVEEAALTGESVPTEKSNALLEGEAFSLGDRANMAYKGTAVTYGRGTGIVIATGMKTELGRIATMLQEEEEGKTPLQKRLIRFGRKLAMAILSICVLVFITGLLRGEPPLLMLLTAVSLAVAAIPEALPAVITISLALGAKKLVKQNVLIRKLPAVETLGSVTYICSDKTGTLTMNSMTVEELWVNGSSVRTSTLGRWEGGKGPFSVFLTAMALSNDAAAGADETVIGDPTEIALFSLALEVGFDRKELEKKHPRLAEIPFDSERKRMTTFHPWEDGQIVSFTKGAVEVMVECSRSVLADDGEKYLETDEALEVSDRISAEGLRTLGFAMKLWPRLPDDMSPGNVESGLTLVGIAGLMDPPREEAMAAVEQCKAAGIRPVMITGDHPLTAREVAKRIGIFSDDGQAVMTGRELDELTLEEFEDRVEKISVYARVAPEQKLKIVKALQDKGHFAAMTGDGVNDAPALKRADIGVAMGITGTDVSKEAAHMILLDDNFATIVKAVREGRRIFDNIRKFIKYTMTSNSGEIWTIFLAPFFGLPIPLLPIHILWINLVTDGLPGLALAVEPPDGDVMKRPPRHPKESIFSGGLGWHIIWGGLLMGFVSIGAQAWAFTAGRESWQTMVFTVLCLSQMGQLLAIRSERESLFTQGIMSNKPLAGAFVLTFFLQMATIYVPFLNPIFKTTPLSALELIVALILSTAVFIAIEISKWWKRRKG